LIKRGEEPGQGVGYLDDGTMVVTEQGAYHLGETVRLTVTSVLQTSAGRMIFGRIDSGGPGRPAGLNTGAGAGTRPHSRPDPGPAGGPGHSPPPHPHHADRERERDGGPGGR